jgi:hypothetical protein
MNFFIANKLNVIKFSLNFFSPNKFIANKCCMNFFTVNKFFLNKCSANKLITRHSDDFPKRHFQCPLILYVLLKQ